jgi:hypothetical protein
MYEQPKDRVHTLRFPLAVWTLPRPDIPDTWRVFHAWRPIPGDVNLPHHVGHLVAIDPAREGADKDIVDCYDYKAYEVKYVLEDEAIEVALKWYAEKLPGRTIDATDDYHRRLLLEQGIKILSSKE